jgi:hypothetical protein
MQTTITATVTATMVLLITLLLVDRFPFLRTTTRRGNERGTAEIESSVTERIDVSSQKAELKWGSKLNLL